MSESSPKDANAGKPSPGSPQDRLMNAAGGAAAADEQELWQGDYSMKAMAGVGFSLIVASLVSLALTIYFGANGTAWLIVLSLIGLAWLGYFAVTFYRKLSYHYELTTHRLVHREGFLFRSMDRIELIDVSDVVLKMGPFQALMNVGNIHVVSSDVTHPELIMRGIPDAKRVADLVDNARREERRKRGLHVHSI